MAEQIVSSVLTKLGELLINEYFFLKGVNQQVELVKIDLGQMKSFLRDAEEKKNKGDNRTQQWVRDVRDVSFEIENAIDTYIVQIHNVRGKQVPLWKRCLFTPAEWIAIHKLGNKMSAIQTKISKISQSRNDLGIQNLGEGIVEERLVLRNPVVPDVDNEVVGFEVERGEIISALLDGARTQRRRIVSIVGPGGLGKTTLTRKVFNDPKVKEYFNPLVWLTISNDFKQIQVLKKFYEEVTGDKRNEVEEPGVYLGKLHNHLREKTYLIVLDDVWSGDVLEWLKDGLPDAMKESRVIITTRSLDVANLADINSVFELPFLSKDESLMLLLKNALQISDPLINCPNELLDVATKLVDRCDGLPLAIVVLGRLMSTKRSAQWSQLEKNLDWHRDGPKCMKILASSYHDLPHHLKACFRYLACFPEDHIIDAECLLRMWIAEGFLVYHGEGTLEDEALLCLEELANRSLVQVRVRGWDGFIRTIRVHDLLRDLAMHEAKENDYLLTFPNQNTQTDFNKARQIVIHDHNSVISESEKTLKLAMPNVHSFVNFDWEFPVEITYPLLRVLALHGCRKLTKLPKEFKSMIHLRYLGLEDTHLEQLPKTIGCLQNLQTLNIRRTEIKQIPSSLWKIQSLRHVIGYPIKNPGLPPSANLVNLQTLPQIYIPKSWKDGLPCLPSLRNLSVEINTEREDTGSSIIPDWDTIIITLLGTLNNLVSLSIHGASLPAKIIDIKTSPSYQHLQSLELHGFSNENPLFYTRFPLDTVEMPQKLITLNLGYFSFDKDPMPNLEKLPCLKSLAMLHIQNVEEMICSAGGFPQLEKLFISGWHDLKHLKVEKNSIPLLKDLTLRYCKNLSALPDLKHVTTLQSITIERVSDVLQNEVKFRTGEEWQKIQHIPTMGIW